MNKKEKIEVLKTAGIEVPENFTVAAIDALAEEKGIKFEADPDETPEADNDAELEALIAAKVKAGLSREDAIEVIKRQAAEDAANK